MVGWFDDIKNAVANLMAISSSDAGWLLGLATIIAISITTITILSIGSKEKNGGINLLIPAGIGVAFVSIIGWWPIWALVLIFVFIVLAIMDPFGDRGS